MWEFLPNNDVQYFVNTFVTADADANTHINKVYHFTGLAQQRSVALVYTVQ